MIIQSIDPLVYISTCKSISAKKSYTEETLLFAQQ